MFFAIDNYELGKQREISAGAAVRDCRGYVSSRFSCPECNEAVSLVKRKNSPHFKHHVKTDSSPECDKRVDGHSGLSVYERVGLPIYLQKDIGNTYKLYMGFRALGSEILQRAFTNNGQLTISNKDSRRQRQFSQKITPTNFYPDQTTLVPIDFFPANSQNYLVTYSAGQTTSLIEKAWSNSADGFSSCGAIFSYSDSGGKKIRRGDCIITDENYYVVAKQFSPYYPEISIMPVGKIYLNEQNHNVYIIKVNVSSKSSTQYKRIETYLKNTLGVWLLEKRPELIPLWPPCYENDGLLSSIPSTKIFGAAISGNDIPQVYMYKGANAFPIPVVSDEDGNHTVLLQMFDSELVVSIDRKYAGREIIFRRRKMSFPNFMYCIAIKDEKNTIFDGSELLPIQIISNKLSLTANTKLEVYRKSKEECYQHISVRSNEPVPLTNMKKNDIILAYFESRILAVFSFGEPKEVYSEYDDLTMTSELMKCASGPTIPTPSWLKKYITYSTDCGWHEFSACLFKLMINGEIPISVLKYLLNLKEVF